MFARILLCGLLSGAALLPAPDDSLETATQLLQKKSYVEASALLEDLLLRDALNPALHEQMGLALLGLGAAGRAAQRFDIALELLGDGGDPNQVKRVTRSLQRADPLEKRRSKLRRDATSGLYKASKKLFELGNTERALAAITGLERLAEGKDAPNLVALLEEILASSREVNLDEETQERKEGESWPLLTYKSEHYILEANLEREVVELVAATMDDIHGYYVDLYLDGDDGAVSGSRATIRVHATRDNMLANWSGGSAPEGWWSPGENQVTCYDTRTTTGSLEWMLETLFHEASHQFMTQLERKGGSAPAWLNEGTASFFEGATAMADRRVLWPDAALKRLSSLVAMLGGTLDSPTLEQVLRYSEPGSYPGNYYAWGWGLVYFMQQYEDPKTLEHVLRPLYSNYRERITSRGGESMAIFEEIFLGQSSPLGHEEFEDFEKEWSEWIQQRVAPLHFSAKGKRRELRRSLVDQYSAAADTARGDRKAAVPSLELLARALGHVEYIRKRIDGEEHDTDVELIQLQIDILVELDRPLAAAPLVEHLLDLADAKHWSPSLPDREDLEKLLMKLDRGNWALRQVVSTRNKLTRSARALHDSYLKQEPPQEQRALTLAKRFGTLLGDEEQLLLAARDSQAKLLKEGQLMGIPHALFAPESSWSTVYSEGPKSFLAANGTLTLSNVRPHGRIQTDLIVGDEYEVRATLTREGEIYRSTTQGLVIAATEESDWLVFGLQKSGKAGLWHLSLRPGGGVNTRKLQSISLSEKPADDEAVQISIHVSNGETIRIRVGRAEMVQVPYPDRLNLAKHVGIYVKDGTTTLENALVELFD